MTHRTIEVIVNPSGELTIEAMGFAGADCEKATAFLEKALGAINMKRKKPEYYQCNKIGNQQKLGA